MVLARGARNSREASFHFYGQPTYMSPSKEIGEGISAIVESMKSGALSEETGSELIRILLAAYLEAAISNQVAGYLDQGVSDILLHQLGEGSVAGGRE